MQQTEAASARTARAPAATRAAILAAARAALAERGPEALSVSEVAHRAGVNRTTAYQHFRTREDLIGAVMAEVADEVSSVLTDEAPPGERLENTVRFFVEHPEISRLWMFRLLHEIPMAHREGWHRYVEELRRLAQTPKTQDGIDPEMLGHILAGASHVWSLRMHAYASSEAQVRADTDRFVRELKRLVLFGVLRPESWPHLVASLDASDPPRTG